MLSNDLSESEVLRGAIIFIVAFLLFLMITFGYEDLPPGKTIYDATVGAETEHEVLGLPTTLLVAAIFNGIIYGVIVWLIYTLAEKTGLIPKRQQKQTST